LGLFTICCRGGLRVPLPLCSVVDVECPRPWCCARQMSDTAQPGELMVGGCDRCAARGSGPPGWRRG
jgi:hypothetical protein